MKKRWNTSFSMNISPIIKFKNKLISSLNILLYGSKVKALLVLRIITFLASLSAVGILVYVYGFEPSLPKIERSFDWLNIIFAIFLVTFFVRFLYSFKRTVFFRNRKFETFLMVLILANFVAIFVFDQYWIDRALKVLFVENIAPLYRGFISLYMFVILALEFTKINAAISTIRVKPSTIFIGSFLLLIGVGAGLLMLPAMTVAPGSMRWLDALFTSVSAVCVTGLLVVDTATFFTYKGQLVIMALIQLGGIGIVSFASFFATFIKGGVGIKHHAMLQDITSTESLLSAKGLLVKVISITLIVESITFALLFFTWSSEVVFDSLKDKIFFTLFHAISAFCNAGFSLFSNNLYEPAMREAYVFHLVIAAAVIMGGIGFNTIEDLFSPAALRKRLASPWMDWKISTKIAVWVSVALLILGTLGFYIIEKDNTLADKNFLETLITSFFHSAIRTSGFNTIDTSQLMIPTLLMLMFLMFIGGSSNSVAGGIKTSTFYLIIASAIATIRGTDRIEIGKRTIPNSLLFKALSVFSFAVVINLIGIFILSITDPEIEFVKLVFEQISAFGTVGLTTGITASLSDAGKIMILTSMFLGRVGLLTFAYALSSKSSSRSYRYPSAHIMIG